MQKPWYKKWWGIFLITFVTIVVILAIALGFYVFNIIKNISNENYSAFLGSPSAYQEDAWNKVIEGQNYQEDGIGNYWLGSAKPKVTIVEFADFNCPLCKNSYTKIREISLKYKNDVKIIFRDYPVYEESPNLSLVARCAGEQGLFWPMHDKLFQNQGKFALTQLPELANQIGVDVDRFNNCLSSRKYLTAIQKDFSDAEKLEIVGTPTWFINGQKIEGDIPYNLFIQIVEELIKN